MKPFTDQKRFIWQEEKQRVAYAFGVSEWVENQWGDKSCGNEAITKQGNRLSCASSSNSFEFVLELDKNRSYIPQIIVDYDGTFNIEVYRTECMFDSRNPDLNLIFVYEMGKALFFLGFDLEPYEDAVGMSFSAHEKLEWVLEFCQTVPEQYLLDTWRTDE